MSKGYAVHAIGSPRAAVILALQKLTKDKIDTALRLYVQQATISVGTLIGVGEDGVIFSNTKNWQPTSPDAFDQIGMVPWIQVHEILGNVPEGTTGDFLQSGGNNH